MMILETETAWNVCKERCRRVFNSKTMDPDQLPEIIKQDVTAYRTANRIVQFSYACRDFHKNSPSFFTELDLIKLPL